MINSSQTLREWLKYLTIFLQNNKNSDSPSVLSKKTHKLLSTIHFTSDDILKIIKSLDPNKAPGLGMISVSIMKNFDASISKPPELIFRSCLKKGAFPTEGKNASKPVNKKGDKQNLKSDRSIPLLSVAEKNI